MQSELVKYCLEFLNQQEQIFMLNPTFLHIIFMEN